MRTQAKGSVAPRPHVGSFVRGRRRGRLLALPLLLLRQECFLGKTARKGSVLDKKSSRSTAERQRFAHLPHLGQLSPQVAHLAPRLQVLLVLDHVMHNLLQDCLAQLRALDLVCRDEVIDQTVGQRRFHL